MFKNKKNIIYLALALIIFISIGIFLLSKREKNTPNIGGEDLNTQQESNELSPEEVLKNMEDPYSIVLSEDTSLEITSPKEETFVVSQARMWEATLTGIEHGIFKTNCKWEFYMNDSLYKNREYQSSASADDNTTCAFTSTFIDIAGGLEVKLTVEALDSDGNIVETYSTNRNYTVL